MMFDIPLVEAMFGGSREQKNREPGVAYFQFVPKASWLLQVSQKANEGLSGMKPIRNMWSLAI